PRVNRPGLRDTVTLVTPLLDAGARDVEKVWRLVGVELAWPDERATSSPVTVTLEASVDGGLSWTAVAASTIHGGEKRTHVVVGTLPPSARSRWLQVRVTLSDVTDWCPVIAGVWAEHSTVDPESRRRRWSFAVQCKDQVVRRDGSVEQADARDLARTLW